MRQINIDEIRELVLLIKKANVNTLELFTSCDFSRNANLTMKLFHILSENDIRDIAEVRDFLYKGSKFSEQAFRRMFYRFREKLLNTLFFINMNSSLFAERGKAYYICAKRAVLARMIDERGLKSLSRSIAESALRITLKYEFTDLSLMLSKFILRQLSTFNQDKYLIKKYLKIYKSSSIMYFRELQFYEKCSEIISYLNSAHKLVDIPFNKLEYEELTKKAWIYLNEKPSSDLFRSCSFLILFYNKEQRRFDEYKNNTLLFLKKLFEKSFLSISSLETLLNELLNVCLITKDIKTVKLLHNKYFHYINDNSFNWFVIQFGYIHTLMHCKEYFNCWKELSLAFNNIYFKKQPPVIKQNFYVLQAYAHFLYKIGKISGVTNAKEFRVYKFLNEVPEYSRDKQGVNIPIILVQILFFLADQNHHLIIDRIDSLKLYAYRYLKKDENFRSQCFIRMLGEMVRAGFKRQGTLFRTKTLMDKLKSVPIDTYPATAENEIIPYEDLWEMVLGLLK